MKISKRRGGTGSITYSISISGKEAEAVGFLDSAGESYDVEKFVDEESGILCIRRSFAENGGKRISMLLRDSKDAILDGDPVVDAMQMMRWAKNGIIYESPANKHGKKRAIARIIDNQVIPID